MTAQDFLAAKYGYKKEINDNWDKYIRLWSSWYKGKVKAFHRYRIYNGNRYCWMDRLSLQMAKKVCEDWADLLFNERCKISVNDESSQEQLNDLLTKNDFWSLINESVERSGSTGTGALVASVTGISINEDANVVDLVEAQTRIEYVDAEWIYPISWSKNDITECAFGAKRTIKGKDYVFLSVHMLEDGQYVIHNHVLLESNGTLREMDTDDTFARFETGSGIKWFAILRPAGANQIIPSSPWGIPYFANSIDTLKSLDTAFDALNNEINLGRKRIFMRTETINVLPTGEIAPTFDPTDITVYMLPPGAQSKDLIQSDSTTLRVNEIKADIELDLNILSEQTGFGQGHYQFTQAGVQTATGVISQNNAMFRRKKKHEIPLESALYDIIQAVSYASTAFGTYSINTDGLEIHFDDSIIEDKEALSARCLRELSASVISPVEYRMEVKGESKDVAEQAIKEIKEEYPTMSQLLGAQ